MNFDQPQLTKEEREMEQWRILEVRNAHDTLEGNERNQAIIAINQKVCDWKIAHPGLVKDEAMF